MESWPTIVKEDHRLAETLRNRTFRVWRSLHRRCSKVVIDFLKIPEDSLPPHKKTWLFVFLRRTAHPLQVPTDAEPIDSPGRQSSANRVTIYVHQLRSSTLYSLFEEEEEEVDNEFGRNSMSKALQCWILSIFDIILLTWKAVREETKWIGYALTIMIEIDRKSRRIRFFFC